MTLEAEMEMRADVSPNGLSRRADPAESIRVLCTTDLSPRSLPAVARGALLANQLNARVTLLHVIGAVQGMDHLRIARDEMEQQLASTGHQVPGDLRIVLRAGGYVDTIAVVAKEIDADIIVLGAERRRSVPRLLAGAAERLIALTGRPALIVNKSPRVRYGAVVIAAELSDAFTQVLRIASSLRLLEAENVSVVHGFEKRYRGPFYAEGLDVTAAKRNVEAWERAARQRLLAKISAAGVESSRFRIVSHEARPIRAIRRVLRSVQPDLLIVGSNDLSMLNGALRVGGMTDVLRNLEYDVLVAGQEGELVALLN